MFKFSEMKASHKENEKQEESASILPFYSDRRAVVSDDIQPDRPGRIYYQSTYWHGCALQNSCLRKGEIVQVLERRGNTWLVEVCSKTN